MKKIFFIILSVSLLMTVSLSAQKKTEVLLKFSKQEDLMRLVIEAEEAFIDKIKVTTSPGQIKIEFPGPVSLTSPKDISFELVTSEKSLTINLKEKSETRFFRLPSPSRIVFDIRKKESLALKQPEKKEEKLPEKPSATQPEQQAEKPLPAPHRGFVIDPGHGGYDFGQTFATINEKDLSVGLAKDLGANLAKKGKKVFLTRKVDQYISITDRINFVNQKNPEVFISLHASSSEKFCIYGPKVDEQGQDDIRSTYSLASKQKKYVGKSRAMSEQIEKALKEEFKEEILRWEMPLPILNSIGAAAILIEYPAPEFLVYDQQTRTKLINAIIKGLSAYGQ